MFAQEGAIPEYVGNALREALEAQRSSLVAWDDAPSALVKLPEAPVGSADAAEGGGSLHRVVFHARASDEVERPIVVLGLHARNL